MRAIKCNCRHLLNMHLNHAPMTPAEGAEEVKAAALIIVIILLNFL